MDYNGQGGDASILAIEMQRVGRILQRALGENVTQVIVQWQPWIYMVGVREPRSIMKWREITNVEEDVARGDGASSMTRRIV